jgi:chaperonin GroES
MPKVDIEMVGDRVAIIRDAANEKMGSIILPDDAREKLRPRTGIIVALGPGRRSPEGQLVPLSPKLVEGKRIVYSPYGGGIFTMPDKTEILILQEGEIWAVLP